MKIAVRMDDITPRMDWENFERFRGLLKEYGVKPLVGIVPDNRDENLNKDKGAALNGGSLEEHFWKQVSVWKCEGWTVALHGYQHLYTQKKGGCFPLNRFSEFAGLSLEQQKRMLETGKDIFASHGIETDIFMAPAHSYDRNTLRALKELGFTKLTDGFGIKPYIRGGIIFYPISFKLSSSMKKKKGVTTMVVHTNTMKDSDFERCRNIFQCSEMISYEEYLKLPAVRRGWIQNIVEYVMASTKRLLVKFL